MNLFFWKKLPADFNVSIIDEEYTLSLANQLSRYSLFTSIFKNFSKFPIINILDSTTIKRLKKINLTEDQNEKRYLLRFYSDYLKYQILIYFLKIQSVNLIKINRKSFEGYFRQLKFDNLNDTQFFIKISLKFSKNNFDDLFLFLKENYKNEDFFKIFILIYLEKYQDETTDLLLDIDFTIFDNDESKSKFISELILNGKLSKNLKHNAEIFEPSLIFLHLEKEILKNEMNNF